MRIPLIPQLGSGRSPNVDAQLLENWYEEYDQDNPRQQNYLIQTPGLALVSDFSGTEPGHTVGLHYYNSNLVVAAGGVLGYTLYTATLDLVPTIASIGSLSGFNPNGLDYISMLDNGPHNGKQVWVCDGSNAWVYDTSGGGTLTKMSTGAPNYPAGGVAWITQQDTFGIFGVPNSARFYVTDSENFAHVTSGNFAQPQTITDTLVRGISDNTRLYLFGASGMEVWYNSGDPNFTFTRIPGAIFPIGCAGVNTPTVIDNSIMWVGNNSWGGLSVFQIRGENSPMVVSTPQIDYLLEKDGFSPTFAFAQTYKANGHEFYVLHSGTGFCFVYDVTTGKWHQRITSYDGASDWSAGALAYVPPTVTSPYADNVLASVFETPIGYGTAIIAQVADNWNEDLGQPINHVLITPHLNDEDKRLFVNSLQVIANFGPGNGDVPQVTQGTLTLTYSKDNGNTFTSTQTYNITSNNIQRMLFRRLGWARDWVFKITYTPATPTSLGQNLPGLIIMNAFADIMYRTEGAPQQVGA